MGYLLLMGTVLSLFGLRFVIFTNDHAPAHVHVIRDGQHTRIEIETLEVLGKNNLSRKDMKTALEVIGQNRDLFRAYWRNYHG